MAKSELLWQIVFSIQLGKKSFTKNQMFIFGCGTQSFNEIIVMENQSQALQMDSSLSCWKQMDWNGAKWQQEQQKGGWDQVNHIWIITSAGCDNITLQNTIASSTYLLIFFY